MSYKTFYGKPGVEIDDDWSTPLLMKDTNYFQVEYSTKEAPTAPKNLQYYFDLLINSGNAEPSFEQVEAAFRAENTD